MKKSRCNFMIGLLFLPFLSFSQYTYQWAFTMGAEFTDASYDMAIDKDGDIYITGIISEPIDFDPGEGIVLPGNIASSNIFFAKYSSEGELIFVKSIGNDSISEYSFNISVDLNKNIYISGLIPSNTDIDPGVGVVIPEIEGENGFVAKYDSSGNYIYTIPINSFSSGVISKSDNIGNLYICGWFINQVDFDIGPGEYILDGGNWGAINYLAKFDSIGNIIYALKFDTIQTFFDNPNMYITDLHGDPEGNVFITGYYNGGIDFDTGPGENVLNSGMQESFFISKFDPYGNFIFVKSLNGSEGTYCYNSLIDLDEDNNIYLTATLLGTIDVDPGLENIEVITGDAENAFFAKYDFTGSLVFTRQIKNTVGNNGTNCLVLGENKNIYLGGTFSGTIDLDPAISEAIYNDPNTSNIFVSKYDNTGNYLSSFVIGGPDFETAFGMCLDNQGSLFLTGEYYTNINLDPYGQDIYTSNGYQDIFVAKYGQNLTHTTDLVHDKSNITVTPNPGTELFRISFQDSKGINSIRIVDMNGNEVNAGQQFSETIVVDLEQLPSGVYLGIVSNTSGVQTVKLVKI